MEKMDFTKFVGDERPDVEDIPGFELYYNSIFNRWAYRPIEGYSEKYLTKNCFVPTKDTDNTLFSDSDTDTVRTKGNGSLRTAKRKKDDEFYTTLEDITKEVYNYREFFRDRDVICPCDKAFNEGRSEFVNYFKRVKKSWGINKITFVQYNPNGRGYLWVMDGDMDASHVDESKIDTYLLDGDGSFSNDECKKIWGERDKNGNLPIIVTNPPFSLFRDFINQIMDIGNQFLIIGNSNAITYKEVFSCIRDNKIWLGYNYVKKFKTTLTEVEDPKKQVKENGIVYQKFGNICWFTNLKHSKRQEKLNPWKVFDSKQYCKYDNYDAINVDKIEDIPVYNGVMGVPITFLNNYCPDEFEIIGGFNGYKECDYENGLICGDLTEYIDSKTGKTKIWRGPTVNKEAIYYRLLIKKVGN